MPETEMHSLYVSIGSVPISKMTPFVPSAHFARFYLRFNWIDFGRCPFFVLSFLPSFPIPIPFRNWRSVERRNGKPAPSFAVDVDTPVYVGPARPRRRPRETAGPGKSGLRRRTRFCTSAAMISSDFRWRSRSSESGMEMGNVKRTL